MRIAAFFDLDRTLLTANSGSLWVKRERRLRRISAKQVAEATVMFLAYRLGIVDIEASMRKALAIYRGEREEVLARWTREWYETDVQSLISRAACTALEEHRELGHKVVLLTSSSPYISALVSAHLRLDGWISSLYEVRGGLFTGEPVLPLCYGPGKVIYAEAYARREGVDLDQSYFYTDSYTDLPMLHRVGAPRVVNPDFRLRRYARRKCWPVLDWR